MKKLIAAGAAAAATITTVGVVALTGGDGSQTDSAAPSVVAPGASWQAACAAAAPGDTIQVASGIHAAQTLTCRKDGRVTFEFEPGAVVNGLTLVGAKGIVLGGIVNTGLFTLRPSPVRGTTAADALLTEDVQVVNPTLKTFLLRNVDGVRFTGGTVGGHNVSVSGLGVPKIGGYPSTPYRPSRNIVIDGTAFLDIIRTVVGSTHAECLFFDGGTDGVDVIGAWFSNCGVFDIFYGPSSAGGIANVTVRDSLLDVPRDTVGGPAPSAINVKGGATNLRFIGNSILGAIRLDGAAYPGLVRERNAFSGFVSASTAPCDLNDCFRNDLHVLSGPDGVPVGGSPPPPTTTAPPPATTAPPATTEPPPPPATTTPPPTTEPPPATTAPEESLSQREIEAKTRLRMLVLARRAAGWTWARVKVTAVWAAFIELGGR